jgi:hypothetical protein
MTFSKIFRGCGISVAVISSGDFRSTAGAKRPLVERPLEFGKVLYMHILPLPNGG